MSDSREPGIQIIGGESASFASFLPPPDVSRLPPDQRAPALWQDMRQRWQRGRPLRVEDYLETTHFPKDDDALMMDLIYADFALREEHGESPTAQDYMERFPRLRESIAKQFELHAEIESNAATAPPPPPSTIIEPTLASRTVGGFRMVAAIEVDERGETLRAIDPANGSTLMVRLSRDVPADDDWDALTRLLTCWQSVSHPHLVPVRGWGVAGDSAYVAMDLVPGRRLSQVVAGLPTTPDSAVWMTRSLVEAAAALHRAGVAHGDIQLSQVIVDGAGQPRLLPPTADRFIARRTPSDDVRALGTVFRRLLTGTAGQGSIPGHWKPLIDRATSDNASLRPSTAVELHRELTRPPNRRAWLIALAATAVVIAVIAVLAMAAMR